MRGRMGTWRPGAVLLGTTFQNCRGVPFKGRKSLVGWRLKDSSKIGGSKGGRGVGGEVNLPPKHDLKRRGSADSPIWYQIQVFSAINDTLRWVVALNGTPRRGREISFKRHPPRVISKINAGDAWGHGHQGRRFCALRSKTPVGSRLKGARAS